MRMKLESGDVVTLKSGGPDMVIMGKRTYEATYVPNGYAMQLGGNQHTQVIPPKYDRPVMCCWFDDDNKLCRGLFEEECLKAVVDE